MPTSHFLLLGSIYSTISVVLLHHVMLHDSPEACLHQQTSWVSFSADVSFSLANQQVGGCGAILGLDGSCGNIFCVCAMRTLEADSRLHQHTPSGRKERLSHRLPTGSSLDLQGGFFDVCPPYPPSAFAPLQKHLPRVDPADLSGLASSPLQPCPDKLLSESGSRLPADVLHPGAGGPPRSGPEKCRLGSACSFFHRPTLLLASTY